MSDSPTTLHREPAPAKGPAGRKRLPPGAICEEPFRVLFPLGVLIGMSGVSLWPLFFSGLHKFYPGVMHARLMIEGFMASFVIGFLGTAAPRLTGARALSRLELSTILLLLLGTVGLHIGHQHVVGDAAFLLLLLFFGAQLCWRFFRRVSLPPPSFALVAFGFCNAIAGTILLLLGSLGIDDLRWPMLGLLLLYQGFVLYLVLGIGGFLLPRFLALPARPEPEETRELSPVWKGRALFAAGVGAVVLASFFVEVFATMPKLAAAMRFGAAAVFFGWEIPLHRPSERSATITYCVRIALILLLLGLLFPVIWPMQRVAGLHVLFIGGFSLITLTVATRVVLGHSGKGELAAQPLPFLRTAAALLIAAAVLRVVGDFAFSIRGSLLNFASYSWMLAAAVWSWRVLPNVRFGDVEEDTPASNG